MAAASNRINASTSDAARSENISAIQPSWPRAITRNVRRPAAVRVTSCARFETGGAQAVPVPPAARPIRSHRHWRPSCAATARRAVMSPKARSSCALRSYRGNVTLNASWSRRRISPQSDWCRSEGPAKAASRFCGRRAAGPPWFSHPAERQLFPACDRSPSTAGHKTGDGCAQS